MTATCRVRRQTVDAAATEDRGGSANEAQNGSSGANAAGALKDIEQHSYLVYFTRMQCDSAVYLGSSSASKVMLKQ